MATPKAVSDKIEHLIKEGKSPQQAAAMAWSMYRAGRLKPGGVYKRVARRGKRR